MKYEDKNKIDTQEYLSKANAKLEVYDSTIKKLALIYGIKSDINHYCDVSKLKKECDKFTKTIETKVKSGETPKRRILTFTINDENGHTSVSTVKSKNISYFDEVLSSHVYSDGDYVLLENIFDHATGGSVGKVGTGILSKYNIEYNEKLNVRDALKKANPKYDLYTEAKEYFQKLVKDDSVDVTEFAEILTEIIPTGRHEGDYEWVTL